MNVTELITLLSPKHYQHMPVQLSIISQHGVCYSDSHIEVTPIEDNEGGFSLELSAFTEESKLNLGLDGTSGIPL